MWWWYQTKTITISNEIPPDPKDSEKVINRTQSNSNSIIISEAKSPYLSKSNKESSVAKCHNLSKSYNEYAAKIPNESQKLNSLKKVSNKIKSVTPQVSKDEFSDTNTSLDVSGEESFSQPLDVSKIMAKHDITITGTELVNMFSTQLSSLHNEIFQLKQKIDELEKEKIKNKINLNDKEKLNKVQTENATLRLENFELLGTVNKLEEKLNLTTENMITLKSLI